jgi:hypothetical protein
MDYETTIALRYLRSKRKDKFISFTARLGLSAPSMSKAHGASPLTTD